MISINDKSVGYLYSIERKEGNSNSGSWEAPGEPRFAKDSVLEVEPFSSNKPGIQGGGNYAVKDKNGRELASATVVFHHKDEQYAFSGLIKAKTAVIDQIQINDEASRNKGQGTALLRRIESDAKNDGMLRIRAMAVASPEFFTKNGYEDVPHTSGRQMQKKL